MISKTFVFFGLLILLGFSNSQANAFPNYDWDGKADFSVFRPSNRTWYLYSTESQTFTGAQWGLETDQLVPADYDGDGLTDTAVWRPNTGDWYIMRTRDNNYSVFRWGGISSV